jgi:hypothetical protein
MGKTEHGNGIRGILAPYSGDIEFKYPFGDRYEYPPMVSLPYRVGGV